ncbi:hypothetical protein V2J09_009659 [Rumex salicifolius]
MTTPPSIQLKTSTTCRLKTSTHSGVSFSKFRFRMLYLKVATTLGNTNSNSGRSGQPHHPSPTLSMSMASNLYPNSISPLQLQSTTAVSTVPLVRPHDTSNLIRTSSQIANLVKPSTFFNPPASSSSSAYMMPTISSMPTTPYGVVGF